ncbi:sugar transferase [Lachnoclostridium sp. Marseille-P6806]|uniref:sugar transferase n=1 Tax=Lachnoclostridium sp. Marseille-P6806 TaxID=2364793 RepID=UPI0010314A7A|nr:sugar transferase [Lachnoclostridium sp. Marseille-P6806]
MNQNKNVFRTYSLWFLDMVCITVSYLIATWIRYGNNNDMASSRIHYLILAVFLMGASVYSFFLDWNHDYLKRGYFRELTAVLKFNAVILLIAVVFVFMARLSLYISRTVFLWFFAIDGAALLTVHCIYKEILRRAMRAELLVTKVLVIAGAEQMESTIIRLRREADAGLEVIGAVLAEPGQAATEMKEDIFGIPVFMGLQNLTELMTTVPFDEVFINTPEISQYRMHGIIAGFEEMGVTVHYNLELPDLEGTAGKVDMFGDYSVISYTRFRYSSKRLLCKRAMDILGGLIGVLLMGIITLFLAPAILIDSPGPVFFSQLRVGKNGRRFRIYKFRSMYRDAEERLRELQGSNEMNGLMFKMENDPRITRVGRFLRRTSLDEFPQFLNVLKGDMSLVGTRPPTEKEFEQYNEHYRRRISMTPGLTGLWQVSGRSDITDFDEVVRLDLQYIDNWSLALDIKILLQTVGVVLFHKGAK